MFCVPVVIECIKSHDIGWEMCFRRVFKSFSMSMVTSRTLIFRCTLLSLVIPLEGVYPVYPVSEEGEWVGNSIPNIPNSSGLHYKPESLHITPVWRSLTVSWPHQVNGNANFQPEMFCPPCRSLIVGRIQ